VGLLTDRINNKLERSYLISEHALNREPVPLRHLFAIEIQLLKEKSKINEIITDVYFLTLLHPNPNPFRHWKA